MLVYITNSMCYKCVIYSYHENRVKRGLQPKIPCDFIIEKPYIICGQKHENILELIKKY
jgi:hypothetical protein